MRSESLRIGVLDQRTEKWSASLSFTRMIALSLKAACAEDDSHAEIGWVSSAGTLDGIKIPVWERRKPRYLPGEVTLRGWWGDRSKSELNETVQFHEIDVILPLLDIKAPISAGKAVGWIPDYQDRVLPDYTPPHERQRRAEITRRLTDSCAGILLSSRTTERQFSVYHRGSQVDCMPIPFPSLFAFERPEASVGAARKKYRLPSKFILVANQFWAHKNHGIVIDAVRRLAVRGLAVPIVLTGLPLDHRDPRNHYVSLLLQQIVASGLAGTVLPLGQVSYSELIDLMRTAALVIQPSRFEGWSTLVQDAKALGRPLLCSDIPVHREQAPTCLGFFDPDDPARLSELIGDHWEACDPGPNHSVELIALDQEQVFARTHGRKLLDFCRKVSGKHVIANADNGN